MSGAYGVSYVLIDAGETALLPAALSPEELGDVNGWRSSAQEGMKLVAPLAGAGLYAWRGGHAVAVLSAVMPVLVASLYAAVRLSRTPPDLPTTRHRGLRAGLRRPVRTAGHARSRSSSRRCRSPCPASRRLPTTRSSPRRWASRRRSSACCSARRAAGSIFGGLVGGRLIARWGPVTVGVVGTVLFALSCLLRCLPWWPGVVAASVVAGVGLPWALVAAVTAVQTHTAAAVLGRVAATANTAMFGPIALAIPLGSATVHLGGRPTLIAAAAICLTVRGRRVPPVPAAAGCGRAPVTADEEGPASVVTTADRVRR